MSCSLLSINTSGSTDWGLSISSSDQRALNLPRCAVNSSSSRDRMLIDLSISNTRLMLEIFPYILLNVLQRALALSQYEYSSRMDGDSELWRMDKTLRSPCSHCSSDTDFEPDSPSTELSFEPTALESFGASVRQWLHNPLPP